MTVLSEVEVKVLYLKYVVCWTAAISRCDNNHFKLSKLWKIKCAVNNSSCNQVLCNALKVIKIICKYANHICEEKKQLSMHNVEHTIFWRGLSANWVGFTFMTDCCVTTWCALQKWITVSKSDWVIWVNCDIVNS